MKLACLVMDLITRAGAYYSLCIDFMKMGAFESSDIVSVIPRTIYFSNSYLFYLVDNCCANCFINACMCSHNQAS